MLSTDSRESITDTLLAVSGSQDVVDASLDFLDRVQVATVIASEDEDFDDDNDDFDDDDDDDLQEYLFKRHRKHYG